MSRSPSTSGQGSRHRTVRALGLAITAVIGLALSTTLAQAQSTDPNGRDHGQDRKAATSADRRRYEDRRTEDRRDAYRREDYRREDTGRDTSPRSDPRAQDYYGGADRRDAGRTGYVDPATTRPPPRTSAPPSDSLGAAWRQQQYEARQGVRDGRIAPLGKVIDEIRRRSPGRQLDAGLETSPSGRTVYRVRWASSDGRRFDYIVDAETGHIIGVDGR